MHLPDHEATPELLTAGHADAVLTPVGDCTFSGRPGTTYGLMLVDA
jgi:hypothetical protein